MTDFNVFHKYRLLHDIKKKNLKFSEDFGGHLCTTLEQAHGNRGAGKITRI